SGAVMIRFWHVIQRVDRNLTRIPQPVEHIVKALDLQALADGVVQLGRAAIDAFAVGAERHRNLDDVDRNALVLQAVDTPVRPHYITSGAATPSRPRLLASACRVAATRAMRIER